MSEYAVLQQTPGLRSRMENEYSPQMSPLLPIVECKIQDNLISPKEIEDIERMIPGFDSVMEMKAGSKDLVKEIENIQTPSKFTDLQLIEELQNFCKTLTAKVQMEFTILIHQILPYRQEVDVKEFLMVYTILKGSSDLPDQLFKEYRVELNNTVLFKDFINSDTLTNKIKKSNRIIERNCIFCLKNNFQELASDLIGMSFYVALEDSLIKQAVNFKTFDFLDYLLKQTKNNFKKTANSATRHASQHTRRSIVESFKSVVQNQISFRTNEDATPKASLSLREKLKGRKIKKIDSEVFAEMVETNKLIQTVIENKREKTSRKYFDMFPFSRFNILDFSVISKAINMVEGRDTFIHAIFLLSKINAITLSEIHVRSIIEHLDNIWKEKLYYFTYTLNPILIAVLICELCHKLSRIFANVKVRLGLLAENYLQLAVLIKNQIHDELFIKTIYIYKFYPSNLTLLQILYKNRNFYSPLLQSDLITELVAEIWYCDYYNTYNVFNTSSAFQNLKGNLYILENINTSLQTNMQSASPNTYSPSIKPQSSLNTNNRVNPISPELVSAAQINPALIDENALKLKALQDINLRNNPFHFIRKSNLFDFKFTNHIFSLFFWQKSPAYRVIIEALIYMIFFILIIQNCFQLFWLRRVFESFPYDILVLMDAMVGLSHGIAPPDSLFVIIYPWMLAHNTTNPEVPLYYASLQPDFCSVMVMFVPEFKSQCTVFNDACNQFWSSADNFVILQCFFFFTLFGTWLELVYGYIINKKINITFKIFSDMVISFTNLYVVIIYYTRIYVKLLIIRDDMLPNYIVVEEVMLVFTFLMWIKFFVYLKLTKTFGYVIKVIEIMVYDLLNFMVIFTIILIAFALILYDLLGQSKVEFVSFLDSVQTLLLFTYGQVDYDNFSSNETLGSILITIFSFISVIILLNLLVAMLNNTYKTIYERSNLENANIFYINYLARKPDKYRSALISFAPPLNLYILPFIPVLLWKKSSRLNYYICLLGFTMFVGVYVSIYLGISLCVIIPLCWLKYIVSIYINVIRRTGKLESYALWAMWFFGGLPYLVYVLFRHDIWMFLKSVYNKSPYKDRLDEITIEEINLIKKTCLQMQNSKKFVTHNEFCNAIRDELTVLNKTTRKFQMNEKWDLTDSNFSNKLLKNSFLKLFSEQKGASTLLGAGRNNKNLEKQLKQNIEIDKMEVFSLIKQYAGVNGNIMLNRMLILLNMLKFCKKFHLIKTNKVKVWKLVNYSQIVDIVAVERAVLGILASNLKSQEQYELVVNNMENASEKQEISIKEKEDNKIVKASKSFMSQMLKTSISLKKKATEHETEEKKNEEEEGRMNEQTINLAN